MKKLFITLAVIAAMLSAPKTSFAGPWKNEFQNIKLPSQAMLEHYTWALPVGSSATYLKSAAAITNGSATTISSFSNSGAPDYPKNILLTPTGTTNNVAAGTAVVTGTNIFGKAISENFTIASAQSTATTGSKAFKSVTSVVFPAASGTGVTLSIGTGVKLGLIHCLNNAGEYVFSEFNGAYESTRGTQAVSSSAVESNTFSPNGSMDGAKPVDLFYVQNFRCFGN